MSNQPLSYNESLYLATLTVLDANDRITIMIIDKLCYRSKLRYNNACEKIALCFLTLCFCIIDRSVILSLFILLTMSSITIFKGKIPARHYFRLMRIPIIFLLMSTIAIIINFSKTPMDAFAFQFKDFYITSSKDSLFHALQLILTALASVSCLYFLSLSTPITDVLGVFKKLHFPDILIELMMLIYRFIFLLFDIAHALTVSSKSRLGTIDFKTSCQSFGQMASALLVRAFKKSNSLYDAMESRCYDGRLLVLDESHPINKKNIILIVLFEFFLITISLLLRHAQIHF